MARGRCSGDGTSGAHLGPGEEGIGLAHNDTEDSLDRLRLEPAWRNRKGAGLGARATEAAIAFVAYLRRFGQSITTLASFPGSSEWKRSNSVKKRLERLETALAAMEREAEGSVVLRDETVEPAGLDEDISVNENHNGQRQLERMERQVTVLQRSLTAMQRAGLLSARTPASDQPSPGHTPVAN